MQQSFPQSLFIQPLRRARPCACPKTTNGDSTQPLTSQCVRPGWQGEARVGSPCPGEELSVSDCSTATLAWVKIHGGTYHIPQDWVLQSSISDDQVESVGAGRRVKFELSLRGIQFKLVHVLAVRLRNKYHLLASLLVMESDKCLDRTITQPFI